jgi:transposase-like protein
MPPHSNRYSADLRERAIRMVAETRSQYSSESAAINAAAIACGIQSPDTLRKWVRSKCSDTRCRTSSGKKCECDCGGAFHGSTRHRSSRRVVPIGVPAQPEPQRRTNILRNVAVGFMVTAVLAIGPLVISETLSGSAAAGNSLSVQVKIDLNKALSELAIALGLHSTQGPGSRTSGPNYYPDCTKNATGDVKQFLTLYRCKQYVTAIRTLTNKGETVQVAFTWLEMTTSALAGKYQTKVDRLGTGNPPGVPLVFNGHCYASGQQEMTVWTVFVRSTGNKNVDWKILQAAARRKFTSSYLQQHCPH